MRPDDKRIWESYDKKTDSWRKRRKRTEDIQTLDAVLDKSTSIELERLQAKEFLGPITGTIASGKEAGVFLAELGREGKKHCKSLSIESPIVVKIYRTRTLNFKRISDYITGDVRFQKHSKKSWKIIKLWAEKEFRNLQRSDQAGVSVPRPILVRRNILIMELIGKEGKPSPLLKKTPTAFTKDTLTQILTQMKCLFSEAKLIHADLSPFNILMKDTRPYFIDMGQSVLISHPKARVFLERDLENVLSTFSLKGVDGPSTNTVLEELLSTVNDELA
ncbi:MAG: serine protein kinase RIO [Candidatus Heimdallarchaeota archaeon]